MSRRTRGKRRKRIKPPRHRGQERHELSKTVRELYPAGGVEGAPAADSWEEELHKVVSEPEPAASRPRSRRRPPSEAGDQPAPADGRTDLRRGVVVAPSSGACRVESDGRALRCVLPSRLALDQQHRLAAGDEVLLAPHGRGFRVHDVLPRRATLSRPDPRNPRRQRVIAANVDVVVQVVSVRRPPLRVALIDRCLIAIERGGARALLCVNKVDLLDGAEERRRCLAELEPYRELGLEILLCAAATGEGIDALRDRLAGSTAVLVGHSGVGKSSLLNALDPGLGVLTGNVSDRHGRGRHTTSRSHLYRLAGDVRIIDTPGIREFGLFELAATDLPAYFPELEAHAAACRFNDCRHYHEPDCAVRAAVDGGALPAARYATYLRILESLVDS